jgi:hypothetical protein
VLTGSQDRDWTFDLKVRAGRHDFVAISEDHALVRRDIAVAGDVALGALDLLGEGQALVPTPLTVANPIAGEDTFVGLGLFTDTTSAEQLAVRRLAETKVLPDSLAAGDQRLNVTSFDNGYARTVIVPYRVGDPTSFTLPDNITGAKFTAADDLTAQWSTLPAFEELFVDVTQESDGNGGVRHQLAISPAFAATTTQVTLDTAIPGFDPAWRIDLAAEHFRFLTAVTGTPSSGTVSSFIEAFATNEPRGAAAGSADVIGEIRSAQLRRLSAISRARCDTSSCRTPGSAPRLR